MKKFIIPWLPFVHDLICIVIAWCFAFSLRFNFLIPSDYFNLMLWTLPFVSLIQGIAFYKFGLYRGIWRFASLPDLRRILNAVILTSILIIVLSFILRTYFVVPRSVLIINPCFLIVMMGGSRFLYRYFKEHVVHGSSGNPVVVLGAGDAAIALLKELTRSNRWRVVGLLDDDNSLHGRDVLGIQVYGALSALDEISKRLNVKHVVVAMPSMKHQSRRLVIEAANELGLSVLTVPGIHELMSGSLSVSQIRPVDVEDLLGRDVVNLDQTGLMELIGSRVVMVSGAGGSIGSELCRQLLKFHPKLLVCVDVSEYALYQLEHDLKKAFPSLNCLYLVADVKSEPRMRNIFMKHAPHVVYHAAAYKHVPLMENGNVCEALLNNVCGTYVVASLCKELGVEKFVLISTDKAVNPTNVMGASKRLAEMVVQGLQDLLGTRFVIVRFGNVLGSSGSVVPMFREQIASGGPVTITHPEITRYFMSIPEASQLVLQAGLMGVGGEIFVLDMGEPVKIVDLASNMIKLSGFKEGEIEIKFVGLRPGEKLYEELLADDESTKLTPHEKLRIANAREVDALWVNSLLEWLSALMGRDEKVIKRELKTWVEEYSPDLRD